MKERLEKERKEKKKQREKDRIARLKQAGLYETKEQKEARERALRQLSALGVVIPAKTGTDSAKVGHEEKGAESEKPITKSKPKYERKRKTDKNQTDAGTI